VFDPARRHLAPGCGAVDPPKGRIHRPKPNRFANRICSATRAFAAADVVTKFLFQCKTAIVCRLVPMATPQRPRRAALGRPRMPALRLAVTQGSRAIATRMSAIRRCETGCANRRNGASRTRPFRRVRAACRLDGSFYAGAPGLGARGAGLPRKRRSPRRSQPPPSAPVLQSR